MTDYELNFFSKKNKCGCLHTSRPIRIGDKSVGTVMVFSKIERARRLALRMNGEEARFCFSDMIGQDPKFLEVVEIAKKSAGSQSNILILGESGSGKDILAQAIHNASSQHSGPFVAVNCSCIPRELIASELFGYADGAFTGASRGGKPGKLELADGGTFFLDEIGDMPFELQTSLLRVLETTITRLGDNTSIPINVRIIAATNRDLYAEVLKKNFRLDLFYRLNVITIHMVPLRERKGDIPLFANHFLRRLSKTLCKYDVRRIDPKVMNIFNHYHWPGNVRELQENVLKRALNVCVGSVISADCLPPEFRNSNASKFGKPVDYYERELIHMLMEKNKNNILKVYSRENGIVAAHPFIGKCSSTTSQSPGMFRCISSASDMACVSTKGCAGAKKIEDLRDT